MKLRVLRWGGCAGLSGWAQCNHKGLDKGGQESQNRERWRWKQRSEWCGPLSQGKQVASKDSPFEPPGGVQPCWAISVFCRPHPGSVRWRVCLCDGGDAEMKIHSPHLQALAWGRAGVWTGSSHSHHHNWSSSAVSKPVGLQVCTC